jgi:hypothetical protein
MIKTEFQEAFTEEWQRIHVPDAHELSILRRIIPWQALIETVSPYYSPDKGKMGNSLRIMIALLLVQRLYQLSDRDVVKRVKDSPYIQYFCNVPEALRMTFVSPTSPLTRFRQRLGVEGIAKIEAEVFGQLKRAKLIDRDDCLMDSTVLPANILYPNDVLLLWKALNKIKSIATTHHTGVSWDSAEAKKRWRAFNLDKKTPLATYLAEFFALFQGALACWRQQTWPEVARWLPLLTCWRLKPSKN